MQKKLRQADHCQNFQKKFSVVAQVVVGGFIFCRWIYFFVECVMFGGYKIICCQNFKNKNFVSWEYFLLRWIFLLTDYFLCQRVLMSVWSRSRMFKLNSCFFSSARKLDRFRSITGLMFNVRLIVAKDFIFCRVRKNYLLSKFKKINFVKSVNAWNVVHTQHLIRINWTTKLSTLSLKLMDVLE